MSKADLQVCTHDSTSPSPGILSRIYGISKFSSNQYEYAGGNTTSFDIW